MTTNTILSVDQGRQLLFKADPDIAELVREVEELQAFYNEAIAAMSATGQAVAPVMNTAHLTLCVGTVTDVIVDVDPTMKKR